jgi:uncharacterized damage-inducible protein DinB
MDMSELEFIVDQIKRSFHGEAWHGPALMEILEGTAPATAAERPIPSAHSIWELVLHVAAWERVIARRTTTKQPLTLSDDENFPPVAEVSESAWRDALQQLRTAHAQLVETASKLAPSRLDEQVPGKDYDIRFMLTGAAQHAAYHGGQIALLKKVTS